MSMEGSRLHGAALMGILIASFALKLFFVTGEPLIYNNDAGYYVEHIREVLEQGYPDVPDPPLAFYYAGAFAAVFGVMFGFKVAISLASAAIAIPVYKIARHISDDPGLALIAAFLTAFSPTNMFMMGDLLKNMLGLFFGAWFIYFAFRASERFTRRDAVLTAVSAVLMLGSHLSSGAHMMSALIPYLLFRGIGEARKPSAESAFCISILAALLVAGAAMIAAKGLASEGGGGVIGLFGGTAFNPAMASEYGIFVFPVFLGLARLRGRQLALFLSYLAVTLMLTQPLFVRTEWQMRFAWNAFVPIAVLTALGIGYFREDRWAFRGIALLAGASALAGFVHSGESISPIIYLEEWQGLLRLHDERPDIVFFGLGGGMRQWVEAAGFGTWTGAKEDAYLLVCDASARAENGWYAGACGMTEQADRAAIEALPAVARFGRFSVVRAAEFHR